VARWQLRGGKLALDAALVAPERVSGWFSSPRGERAPAPDEEVWSPLLGWISRLNSKSIWGISMSQSPGNLVVLDGPSDPREVSGAARNLALDMNLVSFPTTAARVQTRTSTRGTSRGFERATTVAWGSLDVGFLIAKSQALAARIPGAKYRCWKDCPPALFGRSSASLPS